MKKTISLLLTTLAISGAQAATITWSSEVYDNTDYTGTGLFDTTGTLFYAENTGGGAVTHDGIAFGAGTIDFGGSAPVFYNNAFNLADTATYSSTIVSAETVTIGDGGNTGGTAFTVGQTYRIQLLVADWRSGGKTLEVDGVDQGVYSALSGGDLLLTTGTFTADSTTQSFTVAGFNPSGGNLGGQVNALVVQAIPEPSAYGAIAGFLALGWVMLRRRA